MKHLLTYTVFGETLYEMEVGPLASALRYERVILKSQNPRVEFQGGLY